MAIIDEVSVQMKAAMRSKDKLRLTALTRRQEELIQTEQKLRELQGQQGQGGTIVFTGQQQEAIDKYIARRVEIRRELREVRYQLDREIDRLGDKLKIVNIALAPAVLTGLLWLLAFIFKRRAGKAYRTETQS